MLLKEKQEKLITHLMQQSKPVSAKSLADMLDISVRTIKSYIKTINSFSKENLMIFSSKNGYQINKKEAQEFLLDQQEKLPPQRYSERALFILKKILVEHKKPNLFDLCDELFVSYSTLKTDLSKMNLTFAKYDVKFYTRNDIIHMYGNEKDKRRILSNVIIKETANCLVDINTLNDSFDEEFVSKIAKIVRENFIKKGYYLNDFSFTNILLHLCILIDRVRRGNFLEVPSVNLGKILEDSDDLRLMKETADNIEQTFSITLNKIERNEIYILVRINANYRLSDDDMQLKKIIGEDYLEIIHDLLKKVDDLYSIYLDTESFTVPFGLHVKSLITRARLNKYNKNPLLKNIKRDCPIIYDMGIFLSIHLSEIFDISINEDEISFIAIHIGAEIDRQKSDKDKLKCVLICPNYLGVRSKIYDELTLSFSSDISIDNNIQSYDQLASAYFHLLITTVEDSRNNFYPHVQIYPFQIDQQKKEIYKTIYKTQQKKKFNLISQNFENYFNPSDFYILEEDFSKENVIKQICRGFEKEGIIGDDFLQTVLERELVSSTAFGKIAIPHSVYMNALQTRIAVAISQKGIKWDQNIVHIIFLIAINRLDNHQFTVLYDTILTLIDDDMVIEHMQTAKNFSDFKTIFFANL